MECYPFFLIVRRIHRPPKIYCCYPSSFRPLFLTGPPFHLSLTLQVRHVIPLLLSWHGGWNGDDNQFPRPTLYATVTLFSASQTDTVLNELVLDQLWYPFSIFCNRVKLTVTLCDMALPSCFWPGLVWSWLPTAMIPLIWIGVKCRYQEVILQRSFVLLLAVSLVLSLKLFLLQ